MLAGWVNWNGGQLFLPPRPQADSVVLLNQVSDSARHLTSTRGSSLDSTASSAGSEQKKSLAGALFDATDLSGSAQRLLRSVAAPTKKPPTKRRPTNRRPTKKKPTKRRPTKRRPTKKRPTKGKPTPRPTVRRSPPLPPATQSPSPPLAAPVTAPGVPAPVPTLAPEGPATAAPTDAAVNGESANCAVLDGSALRLHWQVIHHSTIN